MSHTTSYVTNAVCKKINEHWTTKMFLLRWLLQTSLLYQTSYKRVCTVTQRSVEHEIVEFVTSHPRHIIVNSYRAVVQIEVTFFNVIETDKVRYDELKLCFIVVHVTLMKTGVDFIGHPFTGEHNDDWS